MSDFGRVTGSREPSPSSSTAGLGPSGFDPARIGDLPERLFAHSLELVDEADEDFVPGTLFNEIQDAALLLAEIRNGAAK